MHVIVSCPFIESRDTAMLHGNAVSRFFFGPNHVNRISFRMLGPQMVCVLHIGTGSGTGLIVPYDVGDYHTWKGHEADLLLGDAPRDLAGTEKCYHVKWVKTPAMANKQIVTQEEFEEKYRSNFEVIDGKEVKFKVTRGGGFSVNGMSMGHLDFVARPLWAPNDKRTR